MKRAAAGTTTPTARRDATAAIQPASVMRSQRKAAEAIDTEFLTLGNRLIHEPQRLAVSRDGMVATAHHGATSAGVKMLEAGGNAFDAAVAAAFASRRRQVWAVKRCCSLARPHPVGRSRSTAHRGRRTARQPKRSATFARNGGAATAPRPSPARRPCSSMSARHTARSPCPRCCSRRSSLRRRVTKSACSSTR